MWFKLSRRCDLRRSRELDHRSRRSPVPEAEHVSGCRQPHLVRGKPTLKFGGQYAHFIYPQFFLSRSLGDYQYANLQEFINDAVPSQAGRTLRGAGTGSFLGTQSLMAGFVQDDIKVSSRLILNLGVRYEYWTNPVGSDTQALNAISNVP